MTLSVEPNSETRHKHINTNSSPRMRTKVDRRLTVASTVVVPGAIAATAFAIAVVVVAVLAAAIVAAAVFAVAVLAVAAPAVT